MKLRNLTLLYLPLVLLALIAGLWSGLLRLGWELPGSQVPLQDMHASLMVSGFLGTLILLERIVALRVRWMYILPGFSALGWVVGLIQPQSILGPGLITLGSLGAVIVLFYIVFKETQIYTLTMAAGAACWLGGNLLWLSGRFVFEIVWWWAAFLILTIAGERLELSRVLRLTAWRKLSFALSVLIFLSGVFISPWLPDWGVRAAAAGMLLLAGWLLVYDIAVKNLRHSYPLTRYIAVCLFSGYFWLGVGATLSLTFGPLISGLRYDAVLHSIFLGFVFSMIFGHAPIILPALTGLQVNFRRSLYLPLFILHGSLVVRVAADLAAWGAVRRWAGLANEIALVIFILLVASSVLFGRRDKNN